MVITKVRTLQLKKFPNVTWLVLETDEGISGLGEAGARYGGEVVRGMIQEVCSRFLLGRNPLDIERLWLSMFRASVDTRVISALDVALWDILGKYARLPIYRLLGGACRDRVKLYNTGLEAGRYHDEEQWKHPGALVEELLEEGIDTVKFGPFDRYAGLSSGGLFVGSPMLPKVLRRGEEFLGHYISPEDLKRGVEVVKAFREAVGNRMQIAIDMHSLYDATTAIKIARALEPCDILWIEDPVLNDDIEALLRVKAATSIPVVGGERLRTRYAYRRVFESHAVDMVIVEPLIAGGISETKKIATMAEAYGIPFASHDAFGPVSLLVCSHLNITIPNLLMMESRRQNYRGIPGSLLSRLPEIKDGYIVPIEAPGLGAELKPELWGREDAIVSSREEGD